MEDNLNDSSPDNRLTGDPRKDIIIYGEKARFTSDRQPSNESKKKGWLKKNRNNKLARLILSKTFRGKVVNAKGQIIDSKFKKVLKEFFGLNEEELEEMSNEAAMMFRMVGQAIVEGDQTAAAAILERAYGKPKELTPFDEDDAEEQKPTIVINIVQQADLPPIKEDETDNI